MKCFITFIAACLIGIVIGYGVFGPGKELTNGALNSGIELFRGSAQKTTPGEPPGQQPPSTLTPFQKEQSKTGDSLKNASPNLSDEATGTVPGGPAPNQPRPLNGQDKDDWNSKDIDVIFNILNGAQNRLQGKAVAPRESAAMIAGERDSHGQGSSSATLDRREISHPPSDIKGKITHYARQYGLKESLALAICHVESGFNPKAVSHKGAMGLMQVMPETASIYGIRGKDLLHPDINIRTGLAYFRDMQNYFRNVEMALAAYNCGPSRVLENKIPTETRIYIRNVKNMERYYAKYYI